MRDVFTIPTNARQKPALLGSVCEECEEHFFPKTGQKATCDNPFCPRSTSTTHLSGRGKILSAAIMHETAEGAGDRERASAVILLEEGIKINSLIIGWDGYRSMLSPGAPVELVLQEMGLNDAGEMVIGYAFRLVTGRKKPDMPEAEVPKEDKSKKAAAKAVKKAVKKKVAEKKKIETKKVEKKKATVKKKVVKKKAVKKKVVKKKATVKKKVVKKKATVKKKVVKKKATVKKKFVKKKVVKKKVEKKKIAKKKAAKKPVEKKKVVKKKAPRARKGK